MKKTRRKLLLRSISKTGLAFVATGSIAAVSVALFTGCQCAAASLAAHAFDVQPALSIPAIVSGLGGIGWVMFVLLLAIGAGVCYATIARMADEQRPLIAMQKAMGFTDSEVMAHYMAYGLLSAMLGVVLGLVGGLFAAILLLDLLAAILLLDIIALHFAWSSAVLGALLCVAAYMALSYAACAGRAGKNAAALLRAARLR